MRDRSDTKKLVAHLGRFEEDTIEELTRVHRERFWELVVYPGMPFSHHSHSGQFCDHAVNTLEEVIQDAISKKLHTFCLTEHIPREQIDFYPEELDRQTEASLIQLFDDYHREATRLRERYKDEINIHIGFEGEWIRPSTLGIIHGLLDRYHFDLFVGSVHHMHTIPIDFDHELYAKAREAAGGTDEKLFRDYFDSQFDMLKALQPPVVGHFDLIRLKSDDPERSFQDFPEVWRKICRNLQFIVEYGGVVELNSASIRKGMSEPYPKREICQVSLRSLTQYPT